MKLTLPSSWEHVTIRQYSECIRALEKGDTLDAMIEVLGILSGQPAEVIGKISLPDIQRIFKTVSFIKSVPVGQIQDKITLKSGIYLTNLDISKISAGQYIDLKKATENPKEILFSLHEILACVYVKKGKNYGEIPNAETASIFYDEMPISIAYPVAVFFCNLYNDWISNTRAYLEQEIQKKLKEAKKMISTVTGDGL